MSEDFERSRVEYNAHNQAQADSLASSQQGYLDRAAAAGSSGNMTLYNDSLGSGQMAGLSAAENLYGMTSPEIGDETSDIINRRRQRLEGNSPADTRLREQRNRQVRMARAGGRSAGEQESIKRKAESDIADVGYAREGQALTDYQKLIGNLISGTSQMELSHMGLATASEDIPVPKSGGNGLGSVICTELFKQGYMDEETYELDKAYGARVIAERPHVYIGYRFLANPVVRLMQKSPTFTKLISLPAGSWAEHMTGKRNVFGSIISLVGEFVCGTIGKHIGVKCGNV